MISAMMPKSTCRRATGCLSVPAVAFLVFLLASVVTPLQAAPLTNTIEFSKLLPQRGSVEWKANQQSNELRQESYRKRVAISDAVSPFVPRAASADLINGQNTPPVHPVEADTVGSIFNFVFFTAILVLIGALVARKFAPQVLADLNQRCNPWAEPTEASSFTDHVLSEEKPFGEFVASLRAGPTATPDASAQPAEDPHREFYARAKKRLAAQRKLLQDITREANDAARKKLLVTLYFDLGVLKDEAGFPEALPAWQMASALEGLLKELSGKIRSATPSTLRSVLGGLNLLENLCVPGLKQGLLTDRPLKFLVVDDDLISRQALALSLKKAFSQPDLAVDGPGALIQVKQHAYDVIFLDVQMPGMDGFELCEKIHGSELNRATPVVFVTGNSDFDARAKSTLIGGNDLMGKPFLIFEVTVKALTLALQGRLSSANLPSVPHTKPAPNTPETAPTPSSPMFVVNPLTVRHPVPATAYEGMNQATRAFVNRAIRHLGPLRELCKLVLESADPSARQNLLADGYLRLNSLSQNAPEVVHPAYQLCNAVEGLIRKLLEDTKHATSSALGTIATAVDLLDDLCSPELAADLAINPPIRLLVVDDDLVARRALTGALQTVFEKPESVESGESALALAQTERFDVIFLDVQMPGMNGFEACSKIHDTGRNQDTPVIFVTAQADFTARAEMSRTGGNDLVGKPFLTSEINVKALTFALRGRLQQTKAEAPIKPQTAKPELVS